MQVSLDGYAELTLAFADEDRKAYVWVRLVNGALDDWGDAVGARGGEGIPWQRIADEYADAGTSFEREHATEVVLGAGAGLWPAPASGAQVERPGLRKVTRGAEPVRIRSAG